MLVKTLSQPLCRQGYWACPSFSLLVWSLAESSSAIDVVSRRDICCVGSVMPGTLEELSVDGGDGTMSGKRTWARTAMRDDDTSGVLRLVDCEDGTESD